MRRLGLRLILAACSAGAPERPEILLVGGIFDGETMTFDPETGEITRPHVVYRPSREWRLRADVEVTWPVRDLSRASR
jgi:hypothetical protein